MKQQTEQLSLFSEQAAVPQTKPLRTNVTGIISGPIPDQTGNWYKLEINTLESEGYCKDCQKPVPIYKRQYHDCHTGQKVQSHYHTPCDCRSEHFDEWQKRNEENRAQDLDSRGGDDALATGKMEEEAGK